MARRKGTPAERDALRKKAIEVATRRILHEPATDTLPNGGKVSGTQTEQPAAVPQEQPIVTAVTAAEGLDALAQMVVAPAEAGSSKGISPENTTAENPSELTRLLATTPAGLSLPTTNNAFVMEAQVGAGGPHTPEEPALPAPITPTTSQVVEPDVPLAPTRETDLTLLLNLNPLISEARAHATSLDSDLDVSTSEAVSNPEPVPASAEKGQVAPKDTYGEVTTRELGIGRISLERLKNPIPFYVNIGKEKGLTFTLLISPTTTDSMKVTINQYADQGGTHGASIRTGCSGFNLILDGKKKDRELRFSEVDKDGNKRFYIIEAEKMEKTEFLFIYPARIAKWYETIFNKSEFRQMELINENEEKISAPVKKPTLLVKRRWIITAVVGILTAGIIEYNTRHNHAQLHSSEVHAPRTPALNPGQSQNQQVPAPIETIRIPTTVAASGTVAVPRSEQAPPAHVAPPAPVAAPPITPPVAIPAPPSTPPAPVAPVAHPAHAASHRPARPGTTIDLWH